LANTLKHTANKRNTKNVHVWNSHRQHAAAARLLETRPCYGRQLLSQQQLE